MIMASSSGVRNHHHQVVSKFWPPAMLLLIATSTSQTCTNGGCGVQAFQIPTRSHRPSSAWTWAPSSGPQGSSRSSSTSLYFGHPFGEPDPPLSTLVNVTADFTLASTPENYLPLEDNQRLVCIGDVHGDYRALTDFLELAGVLEFVAEEDKATANDNEEAEEEYDPVDDEPIFLKHRHRPSPSVAAPTVPKWVGGNTILVQCGDVLDRGSEELACYTLLARLSHLAETAGGRVVLLIGNHEALNAMGLFQYATTDVEYERVVGTVIDKQLAETFGVDGHSEANGKETAANSGAVGTYGGAIPKGLTGAVNTYGGVAPNGANGKDGAMWRTQYVGNQPARWAAYEPNGLLAQSLMANMKVAIQVGRTVCVHAGLTAEHLQEYGGIAGLNDQARAYILGETLNSRVSYNNRGNYASSQQPWIDAEKRQSTYINSIPKFLGGGIGASSPVWMRDYSAPADGPPKNPYAMAMIDRALSAVGECDRMVMGHTVQSRINAALDGKAWRVDVGASRGVIAGAPEVLEVVNEHGNERVTVLTKYGPVPGMDRQVLAMAGLF